MAGTAAPPAVPAPSATPMKKILFLVLATLISGGIDGSAQTGDLFTAAKTNNVALAQMLLRSGVDIDRQDEKGYTALIYATYDDNFDVAKFLLENGADAEKRDRSGRTALMGACFKGRDQEVALLLSHGAKTSAKDSNGLTSTMYAVMSGHLSIVQMLRKDSTARPDDAR